ncbi:uncharacterized protein LOC126744160 [Anthonomus grandis grandis]|uniref:uncharacterized protein LOC126744160 n=1 Tax=Anthonomus grandis grandis TaxID=2921223 RepID=UPI0021657653|nr:uncharacterized protein LOC126744160 [Anthonomus grandis grandis]
MAEVGVAKFFKPFNISIAFKTSNSVKRNLVKPLDKPDPLSKSGVYSLHCADCPTIYAGQSERKISTRVQEHLGLVNKFKATDIVETKSAFANHLLSTGHNFSYPNNVAVVHDCQKGKKLDLLEKLEITRAKNSPVLPWVNNVFNFEPGLIFNNIL